MRIDEHHNVVSNIQTIILSENYLTEGGWWGRGPATLPLRMAIDRGRQTRPAAVHYGKKRGVIVTNIVKSLFDTSNLPKITV